MSVQFRRVQHFVSCDNGWNESCGKVLRLGVSVCSDFEDIVAANLSRIEGFLCDRTQAKA